MSAFGIDFSVVSSVICDEITNANVRMWLWIEYNWRIKFIPFDAIKCIYEEGKEDDLTIFDLIHDDKSLLILLYQRFYNNYDIIYVQIH